MTQLPVGAPVEAFSGLICNKATNNPPLTNATANFDFCPTFDIKNLFSQIKNQKSQKTPIKTIKRQPPAL
jgi:hypothetical protein